MNTPLDYAPASESDRRKPLQKLLIGLAIAGALAILAVIGLLELVLFVSVLEIRRDATHPFNATYPLTLQQNMQGKSGSVFMFSPMGMPIYNHVAQSGNGHKVIVSIKADATMGSGMPRVFLNVCTSTLPNFWPGSRWQILQVSGLNIDADILYSGEPDPADESHITIKYGRNGKTDIIDGWLMPDDTVKLEPRGKFQ